MKLMNQIVLLFKELSVVFLLTFLSYSVFSQQEFYPFTFNNLDGLSDTVGNEIVPPIYDYWRISKNQKLIIFRPRYDSDDLTLCFDVTAKKAKKFKSFYEDEITIQNESYHFVNDDNNKYFQNAESGSIIKPKEEIYGADNLSNQYIIAKYFAKEVVVNRPIPSVTSKEKYSPPKPDENIDYTYNDFIIYKNSPSLTPILKVKAKVYFPLYKAEKTSEPDSNGNIIVEIITIDTKDRAFDFILFKTAKNAYQLYDQDLKLLKKIIVKPNDDEFLSDEILSECELIINHKLSKHSNGYPSVGMGGRSKQPEPKFFTKKVEENYFLIQRTSNEEKIVFSSPYKISYQEEGRIRIENIKEDKVSLFKFDEATLKLFIPTKYLDLLKITIEKNN